MKKIITLWCFYIPLSIVTVCTTATAQTCAEIRADAEKAAKTGDFKGAVLKYLAAQKLCPPAQSEPIQKEILTVFAKIQDLKSKAEKAEIAAKNALKQAETERAKAEKAEKDVKDALKQAEVNLQKAKNEEAKALAEQAKTQKALEEAKAANVRVVAAYLRDIDQHILKLEYDNALEKCQTALALNVDNQKADIAKYILEIAYFYTETDTFQAAIKTLKLLTINALPNRADLLAMIQKNAPPQYFTTLEDRYYPKIIDVQGGTFTMKDDSAKCEVRVDSYKMAETETTVWQYFLYLKANREKPYNTPSWQYWGNNPMIYVSWYDAVEYCNWVSQRRGKSEAYTIDKTRKDPNNTNRSDDVKWIVKTNEQAQGYRLPTEAEWEYAARGGTHQSTFEYSGSDDIEEVAWHSANSSSRTQPVKRLKPNALGLYDMSGNVWEWCNNWYVDKYNISSSKYWNSPEKGSYRSLRGGSWDDGRYYSGVSYRNGSVAYDHRFNFGFRIVGHLQDK